jgi:hypothetical protein
MKRSNNTQNVQNNYNGDLSSVTSSTPLNLQDVQETFKMREIIYGDYDIGIDFRTTVMNAFLKSYKDNRNVEMPQEFRTLFMDILTKLNRLAVSPNHIDSWHDLEGYAKLAKQYCINSERTEHSEHSEDKK